ncbi:MAG: phosphonate C-P lyase system protein PhnG [Methylococcales bacterium]|nr:phosphonate C-P lyase system protein PhnG [Methylococcales bacterium]
MNIPRSTWPRALALLPLTRFEQALNWVTQNWHIEPVQLPASGLAMLQVADSAFGDAYNLGEIPLTTMWLEITTPDGQRAEGAAQLMDDDAEKVRWLAICDAVLSTRLEGFDQVKALLDEGLAKFEQEQRLRQALLSKTRVDFALLSASEDDDED